MDKRKVLIVSSIALAVLILAPQVGFADDMLEAALKDDVTRLRDTIFGMPMKIAGIMGGAYGIFQSILTSSPKPFMMWGAIGLIAIFMNKIVSALFGV
jgi:hypothetical protein